MNVFERIKYEAIKVAVEIWLRKKGIPMNAITTQFVAFITQFFATGDATFGPIDLSESQTIKIGNENIQLTEKETLSVEVKKV